MNSRQNKKVSIVLPTLNISRYICECIDSCLGQTYSDFELIVVDGGSTDETLELVRQYQDPRIEVLLQEDNQGKLPGALNLGFAHSCGEYLTWMQGDSLYSPDAIETMVQYLDSHPEADFVYTPFWRIYGGEEEPQLVRALPINGILEWNVVGHCFLYRRSVYETIGAYDVSAYLIEDYEYWLRVAQSFKMVPLDVPPLYYYRLTRDSLTCQPGLIHRRWRMATELKRQRFGLSWRRYWLQMARIDIDEAFACFRDGDYDRVPGLALRGLARNPLRLLNLGVSSITVRSLMKRRGAWSTPGRDCSEET